MSEIGLSKYPRIAMPWGIARLRQVPRARPKRELAPSAITTYLACTSSSTPDSLSFTTAPVTKPSRSRGRTASVPWRSTAPDLTAFSATIVSRSQRRTTNPCEG